MLIAFFDINGIFHFEFILQGQTINRAYYVEILKRLHEAVHRKRTEFCSAIGFFTKPMLQLIRHSVKQFLAQKSITEVKYPPFSPDLAPTDLWLFPEIKSVLKRRRFQDIEDIQKMW
jgi:histone-lysine N-methyltransferase SETMAR